MVEARVRGGQVRVVAVLGDDDAQVLAAPDRHAVARRDEREQLLPALLAQAFRVAPEVADRHVVLVEAALVRVLVPRRVLQRGNVQLGGADDDQLQLVRLEQLESLLTNESN